MANDSGTGNLTSWLSIAGLTALSPPPALPVVAAVAAGRPSTTPADQCVRVMLDERRTAGGGDRLTAGLGGRPTVGTLYSDDGRIVMSAAMRPTAIDAAAAAGNNTSRHFTTALIGGTVCTGPVPGPQF